MLPATLIVNPAAGRARILLAQIPEIVKLLREHGFAAEVKETTAEPGSAAELGAAAAAQAGAAQAGALVIACGGDGTVHGVVQGVAGTGATLGVLPLGTANALARNLGLAMEPVAALRQLLGYTARRIPLGEIEVGDGARRWFAVMAGCGPDGALVRSLARGDAAGLKARFGRQAYYTHAARLFLTRRWPVFEVEYRRAGSDRWQRMSATAVMVARVADLGGVFGGLTPQSRMTDPRLHVQVLRAPAEISFPAWFIFRGRPTPWLRTLEVAELRCLPGEAGSVYAQADAEPMGRLPVSMRVVPDALWLLMP